MHIDVNLNYRNAKSKKKNNWKNWRRYHWHFAKSIKLFFCTMLLSFNLYHIRDFGFSSTNTTKKTTIFMMICSTTTKFKLMKNYLKFSKESKFTSFLFQLFRKTIWISQTNVKSAIKSIIRKYRRRWKINKKNVSILF